MPTARLVINTALRKLGVLAAGRDPRVADQTDALAALQGMYGAWVASGAFGRLCDVVPTGTVYKAYGNVHVLRMGPDPVEVQLPELISPGVVPWGNDYGWFYDYGWLRCCGYYDQNRPPRDGMIVRISDDVGGQTRTYVYEGATKRWQSLEDFNLDDEAPRSQTDPLGLASCLAMEIADDYGDAATIGPATAQQAARYKIALTQRLAAERQPVEGIYC